MECEWDPAKARPNRRKHGVTFEEAATGLADDLAVTATDPGHSRGESRFITFGESSAGRLLVVAHAERRDRSRIISARPAMKGERRIYEEA